MTHYQNFGLVAELGGTGFMTFKLNTTGGVGGLFEKMFHCLISGEKKRWELCRCSSKIKWMLTL